MRHVMKNRYLLLVALVLVIVSTCGRNKLRATLTAEERLKIAEKMYEDGDYLDAKTEFKIITLNFPGSTVSDRAQFFLGECHFQLKEYILANAEYEKLTRIFPNSDFVDDAQYKIALSNYRLSPKYSLDQTNTLKAIEEFQRFLEDYPGSDLLPEANKYMKLCREKLARKDYENAESYRKRTLYEAAIKYYDHVLDNYYDTDYAEKALFGKAEAYRKSGDIEQAKRFYQLYLEKFPDGSKNSRIKSLLSKMLTEEQEG